MDTSEEILQSIYELIGENPSIDTPGVCLELYKADFINPGHQGSELAMWLHEWHREAWETTCSHVDKLIEAGDIVFTDDGKLYRTGYQGESI